jgi:hypothetical protein
MPGADGYNGVRHESTGFGKEDLPQLQDHPAQGRRARDLHEPSAQAAAGLTDFPSALSAANA